MTIMTGSWMKMARTTWMATAVITWMRVQDPEGDYILDPQDGRLLMKADRAKGEAGGWRTIPGGKG